MLGFRGCRLGVVLSRNYLKMQARAIIEAAVNVSVKGIPVKQKSMIPLVGHVKEFILQKNRKTSC